MHFSIELMTKNTGLTLPIPILYLSCPVQNSTLDQIPHVFANI